MADGSATPLTVLKLRENTADLVYLVSSAAERIWKASFDFEEIETSRRKLCKRSGSFNSFHSPKEIRVTNISTTESFSRV